MERSTLTRRGFVRLCAGLGVAVCPLSACAAREGAAWEREALAYEKMDGGLVRCTLCPRQCVVGPGQRGYCEVRENRGGTYWTLVYGRAAAAHIDPVEKKPLFHFLPGSPALSLAAAGCNVECQFCQNWQLSQSRPEDLDARDMPPARVVEMARQEHCPIIAFTYSEPVVFYEWCLDTARLGRKAGIHTVIISNGFIQPDPLKRLCEVLSAVKVDLKAFTERFYQRYVRGELKPVLETIKLVHSLGRHLEVVTLLIPGLNDSDDEVRRLARWLVDTVGPDVPLHFSRFYPAYKMLNLPRTPERTVVRARDIAVDEGVHYAYVGNLPGHEYENTFCPNCKRKVIERYGFYVGGVHLKDGKCAFCGNPIPGVWKA